MDAKLLLLLHTLPEQQRSYVLSRQSELKQKSTAYILWFLFGVHYFYLSKPIINILYWVTGGGFGVWAVIDLFRIPGMIREKNEEIMVELIKEAKSIYPDVSV